MLRQTTDAPSKFQDIIKKSTLLPPRDGSTQGPPARYQLGPIKKVVNGKKQSKTRRWTYGQKDPTKANKTILMVGETGTGKSTLINAMVNYVMGVEMDDGVWFEIVEEEEKRSQFESQTSKVTVYEIFGFEGGRLPYSLTLIDTPGYGNTRGMETDEKVTKQLLDLFSSSKGVCELDAVGFVVKADTNRASGKLEYIRHSVLDLFDADMKEKVVFFMTHSDGLPAPNALKALRAKDQADNFLFNNCQSDIEEDDETLSFAWETTEKAMGKLFLTSDQKSKKTSLKKSKDVLKMRVDLKACVAKLKRTSMYQVAINPVEEARGIDCHLTFINYLPPPFGIACQIYCSRAMVCEDCRANCHYPGCTIALAPCMCEVMARDEEGVLRCTVCPGKCAYDRHVKTTYKYEAVETDECTERQKDELNTCKRNLVMEACEHVERLEKSGNPGSLSVHIQLDFLMEKLNELTDTELRGTDKLLVVGKLEKMKQNAGKGIKEGMAYIQAKCPEKH